MRLDPLFLCRTDQLTESVGRHGDTVPRHTSYVVNTVQAVRYPPTLATLPVATSDRRGRANKARAFQLESLQDDGIITTTNHSLGYIIQRASWMGGGVVLNKSRSSYN